MSNIVSFPTYETTASDFMMWKGFLDLMGIDYKKDVYDDTIEITIDENHLINSENRFGVKVVLVFDISGEFKYFEPYGD